MGKRQERALEMRALEPLEIFVFFFFVLPRCLLNPRQSGTKMRMRSGASMWRRGGQRSGLSFEVDGNGGVRKRQQVRYFLVT